MKKAKDMLALLAQNLERQAVQASFRVLRGSPAGEIDALART